MEILEKLFGSPARVKILKLFLSNSEELMDKLVVQKRTRISLSSATKELNMLEKIGLLKQKYFFKEKNIRNGKTKKVREKGYLLDTTHRLFLPLQSLIIKNSPMTSSEVIKKVNRHGKIKLIITSGIFIQDPESRVDLLVVGDSIKESSIKKVISSMESDLGEPIKYAIFETNDFKYRMGIYDRLIRDILDCPHEVVLDKIGLN